MESRWGRWLMLILIALVALALVLLVPALLSLLEPQTPAEVVVPTVYVPPPTATATATPTATPPPPPTPSPPPPPTPLPALVGYAVHTVEAQETLLSVAARFGSLPQAIASLNRFPSTAPLTPGQPLVIPLFAGQEVSGTIEVRGLEIARGLPGRRVAITLDAGADSAPAAYILDTLREHQVHITFFLTGKWAEENPELVRRIAAEGHEIGNHTYDHPDLRELDEAAIADQVLRTEQIVRELAGQSTRPLLRVPYGARNQAVLDTLARLGFISIYWTVDSLDSVGEPKTVDFLVQRVTHPGVPLDGAIFLMHVGNRTTAEALPAILDYFQQEGYQIVPVSEILRAP